MNGSKKQLKLRCRSDVKKCRYKQIYTALAIKKVRFCHGAKSVEMNISLERAKTNKEYRNINAENADSDLSGQVIFQEEISSAAE